MKKIILVVITALFALTVSADDVDQLLDKYKKYPKAEYLHVPKIMMKMGLAFSKDDMDKGTENIASKISSMSILDLEDCNRDVRDSFMKEINRLQQSGYEPLVKVNNGNQKVSILLRQGGNHIKEILIVNSETDGCQLIQFKGKIRQEDIEKLINNSRIN